MTVQAAIGVFDSLRLTGRDAVCPAHLGFCLGGLIHLVALPNAVSSATATSACRSSLIACTTVCCRLAICTPSYGPACHISAGGAIRDYNYYAALAGLRDMSIHSVAWLELTTTTPLPEARLSRIGITRVWSAIEAMAGGDLLSFGLCPLHGPSLVAAHVDP